MSDATVQIKIYPDREMLALDMAEALRSLALFTGIIQGCEFNTTQDGKLTVSSGRLFMRGRVAEVTGGDVPTPTDLTTTQTCYVEAVCDLRGLSSEPMYIKVCTAQEKADLVAIAQNFQDPVNFNASGGMTMLELGTVTVAAGTGAASNFVANATFGHPHNNIEMLNAEIATLNSSISNSVAALNSTINSKESALNTSISQLNTTLTSNLTTHNNRNNSAFNYFNQRVFGLDRLGVYTVTYPSVSIAAGGRADVEHSNHFGCTYSASVVSGGIAISGPSNQQGEHSVTPFAPYVPTTDAYGNKTSLDPMFTPVAITSITITNAAVGGGKNANKCVINGWGFGTEVGHVYVVNVGTSAALVDVHVKYLYVRNADRVSRTTW